MIFVAYIKEREFYLAKVKIKIAFVGYFKSVFYSFIGKQLRHFVAGFQIKLVVFKFKSCFFIKRMVRAYADKHLLNLCVLLFDIMHIISGDKRYTGLL